MDLYFTDIRIMDSLQKQYSRKLDTCFSCVENFTELPSGCDGILIERKTNSFLADVHDLPTNIFKTKYSVVMKLLILISFTLTNLLNNYTRNYKYIKAPRHEGLMGERRYISTHS